MWRLASHIPQRLTHVSTRHVRATRTRNTDFSGEPDWFMPNVAMSNYVICTVCFQRNLQLLTRLKANRMFAAYDHERETSTFQKIHQIP